jgi:hypothetical protein
MGGWTLWMVEIYICTKAINALWVDSYQDQSPKGEEKSYLGRRVLSSQASLYRLLWGEYHVHRPLFTGCPSGLEIQGKCQVYRSLFTDPPLQVPSLPIPPYRQMAKNIYIQSSLRWLCFLPIKLLRLQLEFKEYPLFNYFATLPILQCITNNKMLCIDYL